MARQPKHWAVRPNLSNISLVRRIPLGMIGGSISGGWAPFSLKEIHTDVDITTGGPLMLGTISVSHLLSTELSHRAVSDHSCGCSTVRLPVERSADQIDPTVELCAKVSSSGRSKR